MTTITATGAPLSWTRRSLTTSCTVRATARGLGSAAVITRRVTSVTGPSAVFGMRDVNTGSRGGEVIVPTAAGEQRPGGPAHLVFQPRLQPKHARYSQRVSGGRVGKLFVTRCAGGLLLVARTLAVPGHCGVPVIAAFPSSLRSRHRGVPGAG